MQGVEFIAEYYALAGTGTKVKKIIAKSLLPRLVSGQRF
jgi:hypothetical protein